MKPEPGQMFKHFKGNYYIVIAVGMHTETGEEMVCYRNTTKEEYWFRPMDSWVKPVSIDGQIKPRFELITAM